MLYLRRIPVFQCVLYTDSPLIQIDAKEYTTLARTADKFFSWGNNANGGLGTGDKVARYSPTNVSVLPVSGALISQTPFIREFVYL